MKQGWEKRKLGDVCEQTTNIKWQEHQGREFEYIDLSAVSRDSLQITETVSITSTNAPSRAKKIVRTNDVIFATTRPTLRRVAKIAEKYDGHICSTGYVVLRGKINVILPDYIFYYLQTELFMDRMESVQRGTSYPAVTDKDVKETILHIPDYLPEQKRIVAILDTCFTAIDKAKANVERNLQNAKDLFRSSLNNLSYEKKRLDELVDIKTGKLDANAATENGKYPFFTCSRDIFRIDNYAYDCEAILLAGNNAVGDFNVKHYQGKFNAYQRTYIITIKENAKVHFRFLYFQILSSLAGLKSKSVGTMTKFLKLPIIKEFEISCPSLEKQNIIVEMLDKLNDQTQSLESKYQQELDALDELKKSILQKAFNGELTETEEAA